MNKTERRHSIKYYAGLDIAMKETFMCIVDEEGERVFESKTPTDPHHIYEEFSKSGVKLEKVGLEALVGSTYKTVSLLNLMSYD